MIKHLTDIIALHPDWTIKLTAGDEELINCANCGIKFKFGDSFGSYECMTDNEFFSLPVCNKCYYNEEWYLNLKKAQDMSRKIYRPGIDEMPSRTTRIN